MIFNMVLLLVMWIIKFIFWLFSGYHGNPLMGTELLVIGKWYYTVAKWQEWVLGTQFQVKSLEKGSARELKESASAI